MERMEPLVVTGIGLTTSLGLGVDANWAALCAGESGLRKLASLDGVDLDGHAIQRGGEAPPLPGCLVQRRPLGRPYVKPSATLHSGRWCWRH